MGELIDKSLDASHATPLACAVSIVLYGVLFGVDRSLIFFFEYSPAIPFEAGAAFVLVWLCGLALGGATLLVLSVLLALWAGAGGVDAVAWGFLDTLCAALGVTSLKSVLRGRDIFASSFATIRFLILGAVLPKAVEGAVAVLVATVVPLTLPHNGFSWWLGGSVGIILTAPLLVIVQASWKPHRKWTEAMALFGGVGFMSLGFAGMSEGTIEAFPLQYLVFPFLLWAVFRIGLGTAAFLLTVSAIATLWGTTAGIGPFVRETVGETSVLLQGFFGVTGITVLILHGALEERRVADEELRQARDDLEVRVRERTTDLHTAVQEAEEANRTKSRLLAAASHDLRQPIHAVALFATALQARVRGKQKMELLAKMQSSLSNLGGMLDSLLDMSRLEKHTIVPEISDFRVQDIFDEMVTSYKPLADAKQLDFRTVPSSAVVRSDKALVSRILGNFVTNAIRYTEQGRVLVGCCHCGGRVRLEVWDTGKGMGEEEVLHIFEPYRRLDGAHSHAADGLGLGLSIAHGLAELLDHPMTVRSLRGKGSVFALEIPKGQAVILADKREDAVRPYSMPFAGHTVLVVEDDEDVLDGMQTILTDWGCQVVLARTAQGAEIEARALDDTLDVVISDYHLREGGTGPSVLNRIAELLHRDVPGIIISGDTQPERRHEIEAAGYYLLTKPVAPVALRPLLRRQLNRKA